MLKASIERIDVEGFAALEDEWRALEERAPQGTPYLTYDWLSAWIDVYQPARLALARVQDEMDGDVAFGLLEARRPKRWRFAGQPVSPERGLLCADGTCADAWVALGAWLRQHPYTWRMLEAESVHLPAVGLPGVRSRAVALLTLNLPPSFDEYLQWTNAKKARKRMRRAERSSATLREVAGDDRPDALRDFVQLHGLRAASKGERHPAVDERLARMLALVDHGQSVRLRTFDLTVAGERVGVTVRLDHGSTAYSYNDGLHPAHMSLSPGMLLEFESIRSAIEQGLVRYDLGPGDFPYKRELGATAEERHSIEAVSAGVRARIASGTDATQRALRYGVRRTLHRLSPGIVIGGSVAEVLPAAL
ncbi:MAG: GNAT family N-acetyltransferase [Thermoleophilaceae bacterium]